MARVNVHVPDELAAAVGEADLNVSAIVQAALADELAAQAADAWLDEVAALRPTGVGHAAVLDAVASAQDELGT